MDLGNQIADRKRTIRTDGYDMSVGEIMAMYRDGDIDIHPEFQRIFRWDSSQKTRLIESILLGIPIPTIFVSQRDDGVWDVIDGVQRISTILEFVGLYKDEEGENQPPLQLQAAEYLPSLQGYYYESNGGHAFSDALKRDFKRSRLSFVIINKESDDNAKYDLFQRLNSGTHLSDQEMRNCLLIMIDPTFFSWLKECSEVPSFKHTVQLSDRKEDEGFRQELVLRFILHHSFENDDTSQMGKEFRERLTNWSRDVASLPSDKFDRIYIKDLFVRTFSLLETALGDHAFRRWDGSREQFLGPFLISAYEAITSGVVAHIDQWEDHPVALAEKIKGMGSDTAFKDNAQGSTRQRVPRLIKYGRSYFSPGE